MSITNTLIKSVFTSVVSTAVGYSLTIYLTYKLIPSEYGSYLLAIAWAGIIGVFIDFSTSSVFSHLAQKYKNLSSAFSLVMTMRILFLLFWIPIIFNSKIFGMNIPFETIYFIWGTLNFGFLFEFKRKNFQFALFVLFEKFLFVSSVFCFLQNGFGHSILYYSFLFASLMSVFGQSYIFRDILYKFRPALHLEMLNYVKKYFPYLIIAVSQLSYGTLSRILLEVKLGLEIFVYFSLSLQIISLVSILQSQVDRIFRPEIVQFTKEKNVNKLAQLCKIYLMLAIAPMTVLSMATIFFSDDLIKLIFGQQYQPVSKYLVSLSPLFVSVPLIRFVDHMLLGLDKFYTNLILNSVIAFLLLISLYSLSFENGYNYALVIVFWQFSHAFLGLFFAKRLFRKSI